VSPPDYDQRLRDLEIAEARRQERDKKLDEIHEAICGEGDDPGLSVRVDRIEQRHAFVEKLGAILFGALSLGLAALGIKWSR
jgi:hypothetical protein